MDIEIHHEITSLLNDKIESGLFPGAVWLVEREGEIVSQGSSGCAELSPERREMSMETMFDLASLTKPLCTGTLFLKKWEDGEVGLEDPVNGYVPRFSGGWRDGVKISHLLSHSSGLPSGIPLEGPDNKSQIVDLVCRAERNYETGKRTLYSDAGFMFLGRILEMTFNRDLDEMAREEIFEPLNMKNTMFCPPKGMRRSIAATERVPKRGRVLVGEVHNGGAHLMGGVSGHAGLFSSVNDLALFCRMMLGKGVRLLSSETVREMTRIWSDDGENAYGLSWFKRKHPIDMVRSDISERAFGHTGFTGTSIWLEPTRDILAVLLTNRIHPQRRPERIPEMNELRAEFHGLASKEPMT